MRYYILVPVMALLLFLRCPAQSATLSDLYKKLNSAGSDSDKVLLYYSISKLYWDRNADSVLLISGKAMEIAERSHYEKGIALAGLSRGVAYSLKEEYPEALSSYLQALRISEKAGMEEMTGRLYEDIGIVYASMDNYTRAKDYYLAALKIAENEGDRYGMANLFINIAERFKDTRAYDSAITYNNMALPIMEALKDSESCAAILLNIGDDYNKMGQPEKGLRYFRKCMTIAGRIHDEEDMAWGWLSIAQAYLGKDKYDLSIQYATTALQQAKLIAFTQIRQECYSVLYSDYRRLGNFEKALDYRNLEISLKDSIYTIDKDKKIKKLEAGYELEKKQHEIDLLNKDRLIQQRDIASERQRHIVFSAGILFFGMWAFFLFKSNQEKERLNKRLKAQNREILLQNEELEELL